MESLMNEWWVWVAAGIVLAALEMLTFTYVFLGLALGAGLTGMLVLGTGLTGTGPMGTPQLWLVFAVLSALSWLGLRRVLKKGQASHFEDDVNDY